MSRRCQASRPRFRASRASLTPAPVDRVELVLEVVGRELAANYLEDELHAINSTGVKLAREAREISGRDVFIAGSIGPLGEDLEARLGSMPGSPSRPMEPAMTSRPEIPAPRAARSAAPSIAWSSSSR